MDRRARSYWDQLALRWRIGVPLAPAPEDVDWFERQARAVRPAGRTALLLGVTASIATMRWPEGTALIAADWSVNMLKNVWPVQGTPPEAHVVCADWRDMPIGDATIGLILGDGCFTALGSHAAGRDLVAEMRRILVPGGTVLMRCFCRPERGIERSQLFEALQSGRFGNLDLFRWLLAVAAQGDSATGVSLGDVWRLWRRGVRDPRALRARYGWADDACANFERMKGSKMSYWFPTLAQLIELTARDFDTIEAGPAGYEWGEVFPRLALRAR